MVEREIAPIKALRILNDKYGVPVYPPEISEAVWGRSLVHDHDIHTLMTRCKSFIETGQYLYNLFRSAAYMLDDEHEFGSWLSFAHEKDERMYMLSARDIDYINQYEVRNDGRLIRRFSKREYELLGILCELSKNGKYSSTGKIAYNFFGIDDYCEREGVRRSIHMLKKKTVGLDSVVIEGKVNEGYLVRRK